ncbi:MAG: DUF167 domain-containing protein [Acidimicrobiales bacterium]
MSRSLYDTATDGLVLRVHVQPGAGRDAIVGTHGDALKLRVAAPPVSGRANEAVLGLLAHELGVPAASLEITAGGTGRAKRVRVTGLDADELDKRLDVALDKPALPRKRR